jgi:hypothetical protein
MKLWKSSGKQDVLPSSTHGDVLVLYFATNALGISWSVLLSAILELMHPMQSEQLTVTTISLFIIHPFIDILSVLRSLQLDGQLPGLWINRHCAAGCKHVARRLLAMVFSLDPNGRKSIPLQ